MTGKGEDGKSTPFLCVKVVISCLYALKCAIMLIYMDIFRVTEDITCDFAFMAMLDFGAFAFGDRYLSSSL